MFFSTSETSIKHRSSHYFQLLVFISFQTVTEIMVKIAIFPASGKIGSSIYTHLFELLPPKELLLISRYPEKTPSRMVQAGIATRKADYNDAESLEKVFDGVSCLILISHPSIESDHRFKVCLVFLSLSLPPRRVSLLLTRMVLIEVGS